MAFKHLTALIGIAAAVVGMFILALLFMFPGFDEGIFASRPNISANQTDNLEIRDDFVANVSKGKDND